MGAVHIMENSFWYGNLEGFTVVRPVFHWDKLLLVEKQLCCKKRLWPGKKRPLELCFPLCRGWGPYHQLCWCPQPVGS